MFAMPAFGMGPMFGGAAAAPAGATAATAAGSQGAADADVGADEDATAEPSAVFGSEAPPVVHLAEAVPKRTGEENENVLFAGGLRLLLCLCGLWGCESVGVWLLAWA